MKKKLISLALLLLTSSAFASDVFHVTAIHKASRDNEKTYHTPFNQNIITGTIGNKRYTLEQLASRFSFHFEVGKDYPVLKVTDKQVKVQVTDKKGRESTEPLNVVTVEEAVKP
jgi:hypothetical protein